MRYFKIMVLAVALALTCITSGAQQVDSSALKALDAKLDEYVRALEAIRPEDQKQDCASIIESCTDSIVRQHVALKLYADYMSSPVMGAEAVAIDIADKWFFTGKVKMKTDIDLMNARIFADFNRSSLIGEPAPALTMEDSRGDSLTLFGAPSKRYSILYFYDTGCPDCLVTSVMLRTSLSLSEHPLELYAVYAGADSLSWREYRDNRLDIKSPMVDVHHLWDPEVKSDFQLKYGVLKTPQMFLIGKDNVILGRRLDVPALESMLANIYASDDYKYGSDESNALLDRIFGSLGDDFKVDDVNALTDRIASQSLPDVAAFKETLGDVFYWMSDKYDGRYKEADKYLIDKYILSRPDIWDTPADTVNVIGYARTMSDLLSRSMPGSSLPDLKIYGTLAAGGVPDFILSASELPSEAVKVNARSRVWNLRRLPSGTYIFFFDTKCQHCRESLAALTKLMSANRKMRVLFISLYDDSAVRSGVSPLESVLDSFDLQLLPMTVKVGKKGFAGERYVDFVRMAGNTFGDKGK